MNLLVKKLSTKNILKPGLMILISVFFGCETQNDLGIRYELDSDANVKFVEFTLPATNIYIDSLRTDGENRILVGDYNDPLTGSVSAEGYFQFSYEKGPMPRKKQTKNVPNPNDTLKLDSLVITFESNAIIPLRGSSFQEFDLFELQDSLESSAIYLSGLQQTAGDKIGSYSKSINTVLDTLYRIKLDGPYSQSFFELISDIAADTTKSISSYVFKSLGLIPNSSSQSIASFNLVSDTSRLVLYSSPVNPESKDTTYLTYFRFTGKNYSHLKRDRSGSNYDGIVEKSNFDLQNGKTIIDPLAGLSTALTITELEDFFEENPNILINNATISFNFESENNRDTLVNFINFFRKSDNGIFGPATVSNPFGNIVMSDNGYLNFQNAPATGSLSSSKNKIILSSTLFYQQLYKEFTPPNDSLTHINISSGASVPIDDLVLISPTDVTLQRTIFKENGIKLRLYYTEVDQ